MKTFCPGEGMPFPKGGYVMKILNRGPFSCLCQVAKEEPWAKTGFFLLYTILVYYFFYIYVTKSKKLCLVILEDNSGQIDHFPEHDFASRPNFFS